jgi:Antitoxin SocA-like, Panacea domain
MSQLTPFNEYRYDLVVAYVLKRINALFDIYDFVKIHALVDAIHVAETGRPVVGGKLEPWAHGPVVRPAYARANRILQGREATDKFEVLKMQGPRPSAGVRPSYVPDTDEFCESELSAMEKAYKLFNTLGQNELYAYFHDPKTFIGYAWNKARETNKDISWQDILDAYEREKGVPSRLARLTLSAMET